MRYNETALYYKSHRSIQMARQLNFGIEWKSFVFVFLYDIYNLNSILLNCLSGGRTNTINIINKALNCKIS